MLKLRGKYHTQKINVCCLNNKKKFLKKKKGKKKILKINKKIKNKKKSVRKTSLCQYKIGYIQFYSTEFFILFFIIF